MKCGSFFPRSCDCTRSTTQTGPVWWMSGVVEVRCGGCPILLMVCWMSSVMDVWCGGCPFLPMVWWMSGVVDVWCGGCPVWWMSGVKDVLFYPWSGGCLVWWMSGVVDVCVVDVVQSVVTKMHKWSCKYKTPPELTIVHCCIGSDRKLFYFTWYVWHLW